MFAEGDEIFLGAGRQCCGGTRVGRKAFREGVDDRSECAVMLDPFPEGGATGSVVTPPPTQPTHTVARACPLEYR